MYGEYMKTIKPKKCKACTREFMPFQSLQKVCGWKCAEVIGKKVEKKKKDVAHKIRKVNMLSTDKRHQTKLAQQWFNKYIRLRDAKDPCLSCQRHHKGQYHAGHYLTVGARSELRFNEFNCHKQCSACNTHLSGNLINYRIFLIYKIGIEKVEWLESYRNVNKPTIEEIIEIKNKYKKKFQEMK